jgi:glycosyltransferase involved in cell wall biosynthesis
MKLSIVLATCNRSMIIHHMLQSIVRLNKDDINIELIVVDQSFDSKTYNVIDVFSSSINIIYVHALRKGLSHSRNIGLSLAKGDFICFGDDDCTYSIDLLDDLLPFLYSRDVDLIGAGVYSPGTSSLTKYTSKNRTCLITLMNMASLITSVSIFVRRDFILNADILFDEKLGLGADFSSCEELDFINNMLRRGARGIYEPSIMVFHEDVSYYSSDKAFNYAKGHGAYCRKLLSYGDVSAYLFFIGKVVKTVMKFPIGFLGGRDYHAKEFLKGFLYGLINYKNKFG